MNKSIKVKLNTSEISKLMKSSEVINLLEKYGNNARIKLGEGYFMDTFIGKNRANISVGVNTIKSYNKNKKENTVLKAVLGK